MPARAASAGGVRGAEACERTGDQNCRKKILHVFSLDSGSHHAAPQKSQNPVIRQCLMFANAEARVATLVRRAECGMNAVCRIFPAVASTRKSGARKTIHHA
jgi:hypothetical protein